MLCVCQLKMQRIKKSKELITSRDKRSTVLPNIVSQCKNPLVRVCLWFTLFLHPSPPCVCARIRIYIQTTIHTALHSNMVAMLGTSKNVLQKSKTYLRCMKFSNAPIRALMRLADVSHFHENNKQRGGTSTYRFYWPQRY